LHVLGVLFKVHPKFPLAQDHIIIDIKDIHQHQSEPKLEFTQLKCGVHTGQKSCLYCNTCDELVCPLCIAKTHNKQHDLIEISEGYHIRAEKRLVLMDIFDVNDNMVLG
jgi:hypothetical protein